MLQIRRAQLLLLLRQRPGLREPLKQPDRIFGGIADGFSVHLASDAVFADAAVLELRLINEKSETTVLRRST